MKKLPIGKQNFKEIIEDGFVYVDKTQQIYELLDAGNLYFLSRPRRFGKSLLVSTLSYLYSGDKELFKDLYICEKTDWKWRTYPILKFNFAKFGHRVENLEQCIQDELYDLAEQYEVNIPENRGFNRQFKVLVQNIVKKHEKVVILIDEYDKPIIDFITEPEKAATNRAILKQLFAPLKNFEAEGYIKLLFITGVTKFTKVSIFSDLNNLTDLTMHPLAKSIVGVTHEEIDNYFLDYVQQAALEQALPQQEILSEMKFWYDGYSWDGKTFLYNPFSILNFFSTKRFEQYWFATGTPTFLIELIQQKKIELTTLEEKLVSSGFFNKFDVEKLDESNNYLYHLLFQTGYLTIRSIRVKYNTPYFRLGYPNQEVRQAFLANLLEAYTYQPSENISDAFFHIYDALEENDLAIFIRQMKILFSGIAYHVFPRKKQKNATAEDEEKNFLAWEGYFQTVIYLILSFLNINIKTEMPKHKGRIDGVIETDKYLYIMEYKLDNSTAIALEQIKEREYITSYLNTKKTIVLVGIAFGREERNVIDWKSEIWERT